ncbi:MAG TPA: Uma2 family endonuclease [Steroidobacteraceae bacterium]|nr:Uma2 family endonuclease [Steroidobacteraceae bacterium]
MVEPTSSHRRLTVDAYYDMARTGLIGPDERVELIEGEVVRMPPIGDRHGSAVEELNELLVQAVAGRARVRCQMPVRLSNYSEPQPDFAVMRPRTGRNDRAHPSATDVFLLVEISNTTIRYDLDVKVPLYARHGVPEVWVIDLKHHKLHFYRSLLEGTYREITSVSDGGITVVPGVANATVDLSEIL